MGQDHSSTKGGLTEGSATGGANHNMPAGSVPAAPLATPVSLADVEGFQVVRLLPFSPAHKAGFVPFFDIITALDKTLFDAESRQALLFFRSHLESHRDQPVCFTIFSLYSRTYRDVYCVPSDEWGGGGVLGCSIEWIRADACPERCVHIVDVLEGSPAACSTNLTANRDYIIGMQTAQETLITLINCEKDFYSRLEAWHEEQRWALERKQLFPNKGVEVPHVLLFLVYNSEANTVDEVEVEMGTNPDAAIGISVATGLLHIIPSVATCPDLAAGTSLPVMNKFASAEHTPVMPIRAQQQELQTLQNVPATLPKGAAPNPHKQSQEPTGSWEQPQYLPSSGEAYARCAVAGSPESYMMTNLQESPRNLYQNLYPPFSQLQQQSTVAAPYPIPPPTSFNVDPPPCTGATGGTVAAAQMGQTPYNLFSNQASPDCDVVGGASLTREGVMVAEHQPKQHAPMVEQSYSSPYLPLHFQSLPLVVDSPVQKNEFHSYATASPLYSALPPPRPPPQQLQVTTTPMFSAQQMPPPLHFPVFPGAAAAKRTPA
ncbi:golgi reassembly stacking protein, putative [Leishmania tarentolae]|uniref:Golgi reassembly stacking protein, putative n=1 Tax=Leishmania tarentolae TaxID=5689 RepID=A0A640KQW8_LEITA|nr:golgi reassembly stacking protein, putative [Leishmania tarentolae]